ncbi:hypothetical protein BsIDN1_63290 [Bacillus safensis]|uniref:Uncharacterized protein n=1 Tax=Bacillus safensis TaxID=561879 RepID=A0A5S9MIC9_BACIA|nr:hypothetical protein BsIDN1_63290 [Bacillus safensis]
MQQRRSFPIISEKKSGGVVRYGFYQTEVKPRPLIHLPELADSMMQALEEGKREDALALFDAFELEGRRFHR